MRGLVGGALARAFYAAGHSVVLSGRHPDRAATVAAEIGADVVVLAVPSTAIAGLCDRISGAVGGKIVLDPTNPRTGAQRVPATAGRRRSHR